MKSGIYLLVETPRAGKLGHRILVSHGFPEGAALAHLDKVRANRIGTNYISVGREVQQKSDSGGIRVGVETIGLVGVDVARISPQVRDAIATQLTECLHLVEELVLHRMDWQSVGENDIILECPELDDWITRYFDKDFPLCKDLSPTIEVPSSGHHRDRRSLVQRERSRLITGLLLVFLGVGLYATWQFLEGTDEYSQDTRELPQPEDEILPSPPETLETIDEQTWTEFARQYDNTEDWKKVRDAIIDAYRTGETGGTNYVDQKKIANDIYTSFALTQEKTPSDGLFSAWMLLPEQDAKLIKFLFGLKDEISPAEARKCQKRIEKIFGFIATFKNKLPADYEVSQEHDCIEEHRADFVTICDNMNKLFESIGGFSSDKTRLKSPYFYKLDADVCDILDKTRAVIDTTNGELGSGGRSGIPPWPSSLNGFDESNLDHVLSEHLTLNSSKELLEKFVENLSRIFSVDSSTE